MRILITGGRGKLAQAICSVNQEHTLFQIGKDELDIRNQADIISYLLAIQPECVIHTAAITKPMITHEQNPCNSIDVNIIGTANLAIVCQHYKVKLVYISTDYIYPGTDGNYKETDPVLPFTNYGWSKLGGECAVRMIDNYLIIRLCLCNYPFEHKYAFDDMIKNYIYEKDAARIILQILDQTGIINVGGPSQSVYDFVKIDNPNIKPRHTKYFKEIPLNTSMSLDKLNAIS